MSTDLTYLQNQLKRNSKAYVAEFRQQLRVFEAQYSIFKLSPPKDSRDFGKLITFLCHVSNLYPEDGKKVAEMVLQLLEHNYETMDGDLRKCLFQGAALLRSKGEIEAVTLLSCCFKLFRCQDKTLRELVFRYIISDVKNINTGAANIKLNKAIQNVVFSMLDDGSETASKKSLQIMVELYKRRVWTDARTVNMIAAACFSKHVKNLVIALHFFLGIDEAIDLWEDEEENENLRMSVEASTGKSKDKLKRSMVTSSKNVTKKTRSRIRKHARDEKAYKRTLEETRDSSERRRTVAPRFPAIEILNDPQGFAERLFSRLRNSNEHFDIRLLIMNLISRVVGYHKLLLLQFYSFLQKYIQPHQQKVTNILAFVVQSAHDLIPSEEFEPIIKQIANGFVNDRTGPEVMAVGLNTIREIISRIPLLTSGEGVDDLIEDLVLYRRFRRDRSVVMAARSLLNLIREINPNVLRGKERGKFYDANAKPLEYGASKAAEGVDGAELLQQLEEEAARLAGSNDDGSDMSQDEEESSHEEEEEEETDDDDDDDDEEEEEEEEEDDEEGKEDMEQDESNKGNNNPKDDGSLLSKSKRSIHQNQRIDATRILSSEDFAKIRKLKQKLEEEKKNPKARRKNVKAKTAESNLKNNLLVKRAKAAGEDINGIDDPEDEASNDDPLLSDVSMSSDDSEEDDDEIVNNGGAVDPRSLEGIVRRKRRELADRLAAVYDGRQTDIKIGEKRSGGTNDTEKSKNKNFLMVSKSKKVRGKLTTSLRQQQYALRKHIKTMEKTKKTIQKIRRKSKR